MAGILDFLQNPQNMRLIDNDGILSIGSVDPTSGSLNMSGGKKVNMVNPSAVLIERPDGQKTLKGATAEVGSNFPPQSDENRKKASLFERFKSLPAGVRMRAGSAMLGADDFTSGMSEAGKVFADYQDTQTPEAKFKSALDLYEQVNDINYKNIQARAKEEKSKKADQMLLGNLGSTISQFDMMSDALSKHPDAVGLGFSTIMADLTGLDPSAFMASNNASIRSALQSLKISETLINTAKTKGAISNAEMRIFMSDQPKFSFDSSQWQAWIKRRSDALKAIQNRIATGQTLEVGSGDNQQATATWEAVNEAQSGWSNIFKDDSSSGDKDLDDADAYLKSLKN